MRMKNRWKKHKPKANRRMKIASGVFDIDDNLVFALINRNKRRFNTIRKAFKFSNIEFNVQNLFYGIKQNSRL